MDSSDSTNILPGNITFNPGAVVDYEAMMTEMLGIKLAGAAQPKLMPYASMIGKTPIKVEYQTKIKSRVSVPLDTAMGRGAALEMTVAGTGEQVEFTLILPGRQATNFNIHRKDIEALMGELTLDKLSK